MNYLDELKSDLRDVGYSRSHIKLAIRTSTGDEPESK